MKQFLLFSLFIFGLTSEIYAQTCAFTANNGVFCTKCKLSTSRLFTVGNGELNGTLSIDDGGPASSSISVNVPLSCDEDAILIGKLTINLGSRDVVNFDQNIGVTPAAKDFDITGSTTGGNAGQVTYKGTTYGRNQGNTKSLAKLVEIIKADAADALAALPITLTSWEATPTPTGIDLSWASANETDNDFYLVEHSTDGRNFEELTQVAGRNLLGGRTDLRLPSRCPRRRHPLLPAQPAGPGRYPHHLRRTDGEIWRSGRRSRLPQPGHARGRDHPRYPGRSRQPLPRGRSPHRGLPVRRRQYTADHPARYPVCRALRTPLRRRKQNADGALSFRAPPYRLRGRAALTGGPGLFIARRIHIYFLFGYCGRAAVPIPDNQQNGG